MKYVGWGWETMTSMLFAGFLGLLVEHVSASWAVPSTAVSGVYIAHLVRDDARPISGESSHIVFVVRNDSGTAPVILQTSDATWEAYNDYGGNSLYVCNAVCPPGPVRAGAAFGGVVGAAFGAGLFGGVPLRKRSRSPAPPDGGAPTAGAFFC